MLFVLFLYGLVQVLCFGRLGMKPATEVKIKHNHLWLVVATELRKRLVSLQLSGKMTKITV